jgi:hypothetical protein
MLTRLKTYAPSPGGIDMLRRNITEQKSDNNSERQSLGKGKNYVLKNESKKIKVMTPSALPSGHPLLNYFKNSDSTLQERKSICDYLIKLDGSDLSLNNNGILDDIKFPLSTNNQNPMISEFKFNINNYNSNNITNTTTPQQSEINMNYDNTDYNMNIFMNKQQDVVNNSSNNNIRNNKERIIDKKEDVSQQQKIVLNYDKPQNNVNKITSNFNQLKEHNNNKEKQINNVTINNNYINHYNITPQDEHINLFEHTPNSHINSLNNTNFTLACSQFSPSFQSSQNQENNNDNNIFNNNVFLSQNIPNRNNTMPLVNKDIHKEKIRKMTRDQNSCRYLQKILDTQPELGNEIFDALEKDLLNLSCGSFGNYLLQKLLTLIDFQRLTRFVDIIVPFFVQVSVSTHGTRVIQKLIDSIKNHCELIMKLNIIINQKFIELTTDPNSNHVIQKYVSVINYPLNAPIYETIFKNFLLISQNKYGCCIMQKSIECGTQEQKNSLIYLSLQHSKLLITDQYGNYVLQYIIISGNSEFIQHIISLIFTNLPKYCKQKFSSNVIEKCLEHSQPDLQNLLINVITQNEALISELITDPFGNYIIQKILQIAKGKIYYQLLTIISNNVDHLTKVSFGPRLLSKLMNTHKDLEFLMKNNNNQLLLYQQQQQQPNQMGQMGYPNYNNNFQGYGTVFGNYNERNYY